MINTSGKRLPFITIALVIINIVYFLYLEMAGSSMDNLFMMRHGAMFTPYVVENKEYFRFITSMFMHFGFDHISNNMLMLCVIGYRLEKTMGSFKFFVLYMLSGIGANVVSMLFDLNLGIQVVSAGASGAVFGIVGGLLYAVLVNKGQLEDLSSRQMMVMILLSLYFGYTSAGVDNVAHVAGLVIGFVLAIVLYHRPRTGGGYSS